MTLFINCCPRKESRTKSLALALLNKLGEYEELKLYEEDIKPLDEERLKYRTQLAQKGDFDDPIFDYAKQFAQADKIVIAAPFWDLSFPSLLKIYFENIYVTGLVTRFGENGRPVGMCKASKLYYVSTSGGPMDTRFGYEYVKAVTVDCFGVKETELIKAEMLDIAGFNAEEILANAIHKLDING